MRLIRDINTNRRGRPRGSNVWVVQCRRGYSVRVGRNGPLLIPPTTIGRTLDIGKHLADANGGDLIVQSENARIRLSRKGPPNRAAQAASSRPEG